jgi:hypothetical protein
MISSGCAAQAKAARRWRVIAFFVVADTRDIKKRGQHV